MNYTKGEWQFTLNTDKKHSEIDIFSQVGKGVKYLGTLNALWLSNEEKLANAHLIAAAPMMYEALKAVLPWAKDWVKYLRNNVGQGQGQNADEQFLKAEKALAKAEGKVTT